MKFFSALSLLALASARELSVVNLGSDGSEVSERYAALGYDSEHTAECVIELDGTEGRFAAGDQDQDYIAKIFKRNLKKTLRRMGNGPIKAQERRLENDSTPRIKVTNAEVTKQRVAEPEDEEGGDRRNLQYNGYGNGWFYTAANYACLFCSGDNSDAGRRHLQEALAEERMLEGIVADLASIERPYLSNAIARGNACVRITCDGGETVGSAGCNSSP